MTLVVLSVATSIDALAVGLSMSMLKVSIAYPAIIIGIVAGLFLSLVLGGCGAQRQDASALQVELREIKIVKTALVSEDVVLLINLKNPTANPIPTSGLSASFYLDGVLVSQGVSRAQVPVPANGAVRIAVAGQINADAFLERSLGQMDPRDLDYQIRGSILTGVLSFAGSPYALSGNLRTVSGGSRSGERLTSGLF